MRIRTQFLILVLLFGIMLVAISVSAVIANRQVDRASSQEQIAAGIAQGASELSYLSNDYVIYQESQQLSRWQSRFDSFYTQVNALQPNTPEQQVLVNNIQASSQRLKEVFDSIASIIGSPSQNQNATIDLAFIQDSWSRMAVQSQGLNSDATHLAQLLHAQADRAEQTNRIVIFVMIGVFSAYLLISSLFIERRTLGSIAKLQRGAAVIGSGNLDFRIEEKSNDEIGDLSRAFNRMTSDLKTVTASKEDLETEIDARKDAEEELRTANEQLQGKAMELEVEIDERKRAKEELQKTHDELETRVKERTAELLLANERLKQENEERVRIMRHLILEESRLDALLHLSQMSEATVNEMAGFILERGIALTRSKIGFVGFLSEDESVYTLNAVSKDVVKECNVTGNPLQWHIAGAGVWADAIRQRKTLFVNDYSQPYPSKKGLLPGHPPVSRLIVVPLFDGKKIVAVAGMGNKESDYDESDERQITLLLDGMWKHVLRNRSREALQEAYDELEHRVEQRTAELRETRDYLNNLLNYANAPIIVWNPSFRITRFNHAFERLTGLNANEVIGKQLDILFPESEREESMGYIRRAVAGERWEVVEISILRKDGTVRTVLWNSATLYDADGKTAVATIAQGQDITERKQAEEEIKRLNRALLDRAAELEASNRELESFSYSVSHDLREPLRTIDGFSRILQKDYADKFDAEGQRLINIVRGGTQKMAQLISDLLAFSRISRKEMELSEIDMSGLAESVSAELRGNVPEQRLQFNIGSLPAARGDPPMIRQVWTNLLSNAVKFSKYKQTSVIEVGSLVKDGDNVYYVKDNGAGFDPQYKNKLFHMFQRLHSEEEFEGTGVGLAIVQRIINRHGGRIWAEGSVGHGATFYFTLSGKEGKS